MNCEEFLFLKGAFGEGFTDAQIMHALDKNERNVEQAMECLLSGSLEMEEPVQVDNLFQMDEDERLARELAQQFEQEVNLYSDEDAAFAKQLQDSEWNPQSTKWEQPDDSDLQNDLLDGMMNSNFNLQDILQSGLISQESMGSLLDQIKQSILPLIQQEVRQMSIPPLDETPSIPKIGRVNFQMPEGVQVDECDLNPDQIQISIEKNQIHCVVGGIHASLEKFPWEFAKESFPRVTDKGMATAMMDGTTIDVLMSVVVARGGASLQVISSQCKIDKLDVKISGNSKKLVYNIVLGSVIRLLKGNIESLLAKLVQDTISEHGKQLLGGAMV